MKVYVLNKRNQPLMPTNPRKARLLLKENKAKIISYDPFVIQLLIATGETKQKITLGIDAGSKHIGVSATTEKSELYSAEIHLRTDITELISSRSESRRSRRGRKTRYRQSRFNNRKRIDGWVAPTIQSKINSHLNIVAKINKILPIDETIVEVASFDIQKIKNPDIQGKEYQQGEQMDFWNVREYVLFRDGHKCHGAKNCKCTILNVHHIESRKIGGDAPNNLITLCEDCHDNYHKGLIKINLKRGKSFKDAAFMGIMRWAFYNKLKEMYKNVKITYGYITKNTRIVNKLEKTHATDAYCITKNITAVRLEDSVIIRQVRKKKRSLHEQTSRSGKKIPNVSSKRNDKNTPKVEYKGIMYSLWDKVLINNQIGFISGFTGNNAYVEDINGKYITISPKYKQINLGLLKIINKNNNWVCQEVSN